MKRNSTILDRYEIASELDRNPHAVVHRAHDCRDDREVVLRTIELSDELSPEVREAFLTRILREAGRTEGFSHPGVVAVYDVDESPDGEATHISMEYVPGPNLAELIATEGALRPDWAFTMAENLGDALQSAHQAGVTLPNLQPAAIVVHESEGVAKIAAAGVAYVSASDPEAPNVVLRTSAYTAPECIRGRESDLRSDLFSLAAILYETLCGRHPFLTDDNEPSQTAILDGSPIPITERASDLTPALNELFSRALAGDPDSRFQNAGEFREALHDARQEQRLFEDRGVEPKPEPESEPESAFVLELQEADADFLAAPQPDTADEPIEPELSLPVIVPEEPPAEAPVKPGSPKPPPIRQKATPRPPVETEPQGSRTKAIVAAAVIVLFLLTVAGWKLFGGASSESVAQNPGESSSIAGNLRLPDPPALKVSEPQVPTPVISEPVEPPAPKIEKTVKAAPKKRASNPKPAKSAKPAEPAPAVTKPVLVVEPEIALAPQPEPTVPAALAPAAIKMSLKSGIKSGSLAIWVDGERIYSTELASGSKRFSRMAKKAVGKGRQTLEAQFDLQPGTHQIDVQVNTVKGKRFEKTVNVDLEAGAQRNLLITAGKTFGNRLLVELD